MFSLTPIEATLWALGVQVQSHLSKTIFCSVLFTTIVITFFSWRLYKLLMHSGMKSEVEQIFYKLMVSVICMIIGLLFIRTFSGQRFYPTDSTGQKWVSYRGITNSGSFKYLHSKDSALFWYEKIHVAFVQVSRFMTDRVGDIFGDEGYGKSPHLVFKSLVSATNVHLDDPEVISNFDSLAAKCSDTTNAAILDNDESIEKLFDLSDPKCRKKFNELKKGLKRWARRNIPEAIKNIRQMNQDETPSSIEGFQRREIVENTMIASAVMSHVKTKYRGYKDRINTNHKALGLQDKWDYFYYNLQKCLSGGGTYTTIASFFTEKNLDGIIVKNEAAMIYNNLLNLIPSIKGYIKLFISVSFLFVFACFACGFEKPVFWWLRICLIEMFYEPLSTLNYQIHTTLLASSSIKDSYESISSDPMVLLGAASIESELAFYQTAYFITQMAIASFFVFGVIQSGWAVRSMSFMHGAALGMLFKNSMTRKVMSMFSK